MRSYRLELTKQMTDVLDEIIPTLAIGEGTSALVARIGKSILKAAAEERASYQTLLAAASDERARLEGVSGDAEMMASNALIT